MTTPNGENTHDDADCVKLFTETLERLNEINISQMQAILDIAVAAADAASTIDPGNAAGGDFVDKVTKLVHELKAKADGDMGNGGDTPAHGDGGKGDKLCESVERAVNIAIENSLANQQQLYVTGAAVLAEGAQLVLSSVKNNV